MAEFKLKIAVWYLKMVRTEMQEVIAILCQKDILSKEDAKVIQQLAQVLQKLDTGTIQHHQKASYWLHRGEQKRPDN